MKKSTSLRFVPNRTNLLSGNQSGAIIKAMKNIIVRGFDVDHVVNRKGAAYLKLKRDKTANTKFHFRAYTYTHTGRQVEITRQFHNNCEMMLLDEVLKVTRPYNPNYL